MYFQYGRWPDQYLEHWRDSGNVLCVKLNHCTWKAISASYQADVLMQTPAYGTRKWVFGFQQVLDRQPSIDPEHCARYKRGGRFGLLP